MIGIFAIFVRFKIVNDSAKMSFIKKNQIGSVPTIDGSWIAIVTEWVYVFKKSCSQVHDKKSQQKYGEHLTSDFLFQGLYQ